MGPLWAQLLLQFSTDCFETLQMFSAWNEDVHVVLVQYLDYFNFLLVMLCELSLFFDMKCYQSVETVGTLLAQLLLQFSTDCFETLQMFSAWN